LHFEIPWLSAEKCLERFLAFRREIPLLLKDNISSDTTDLEQEMLNPTFLCELAFLTDIIKHINDLNMKLQGEQQNVSNLFGHVNGFHNKLKLFKTAIDRNDLTFRAVKNSVTMKVQTSPRLFQTLRELWKNLKQVSMSLRS
jgi:hypothetical protein